jgi:HEAT repeat protein
MNQLTLDQLIQDIQSEDHNVRAAARDQAGKIGAVAVRPLGEIAAGDNFEIARAANRAIQNIVYFAGRPGAEAEAAAVAAELLGLLDESNPTQLRKDALWMIWQIAGEQATTRVAACLRDPEIAEDARMALERLPGQGATAALQAAFEIASEEDRPALAYSLGMRGITVEGAADLRLKGVKQSTYVPEGAPASR